MVLATGAHQGLLAKLARGEFTATRIGGLPWSRTPALIAAVSGPFPDLDDQPGLFGKRK